MIDWDRVATLREEVGPDEFEEVIELFLQEVDEEIEKLEGKLADGNLAEHLHFLKGSAVSLGFDAFSKLCQQGESALSTNPTSQVDLAALHGTYQQSRSVLLNDLPSRLAS